MDKLNINRTVIYHENNLKKKKESKLCFSKIGNNNFLNKNGNTFYYPVKICINQMNM